jgi:hypothetical protein
MKHSAGPLYELTFFVEPELVAEFDPWLAAKAEQSLREPGVVDVRTFEIGADDHGRAGRICQFRARDDNAIDELLDGHFTDLEATTAEEHGEAVSVFGRILREDTEHDIAPVESPDCLNCGTHLRGQYCGSCGQRARNRLISLWELVSEAFGDLLELDSRLWRTLIPLLVRPGQLTRDYLEGRRARYMPPFRTYLVLSLIFFVVAFFDPRDDLSLLFEPEPQPTPEEVAAQQAQAEEAKEDVLRDLAEEGIIVGDETPENEIERSDGQEEPDEYSSGFNLQIDDDTGECSVEGDDLDELPEWLKRRLTPERLERVCERVAADEGATFVDLLLDNIPVALIVLLPLMALVLKVLYPLSRRYFVEHLLFFVHFHAFFFLMLTLQILFSRIAALVRVPEAIAILVIVAAAFYIPVYLYMAMRRVYGQGHILTFIKYIGLVVCYWLGAALTMFGAVLFALVAV